MLELEYFYERNGILSNINRQSISEDELIGLIRILNGDSVAGIISVKSEEQSDKIEELENRICELESELENLNIQYEESLGRIVELNDDIGDMASDYQNTIESMDEQIRYMSEQGEW